MRKQVFLKTQDILSCFRRSQIVLNYRGNSCMNIYHLLAVGIGGLIGSVGRYLASRSIDEKVTSLFPFGTLAVNIIGSLILGFLYGLTLKRIDLAEHWRLFIGTGICGGFTTFSAFALENFTLLHQKPVVAVIYIASTLIIGLIAVALGVFLGRAA